MNNMLRIPSNDNAPFEADFKGIPELFLKVYQAELMGWARELTKGNVCTIDLINPPNTSMVSAGWQGRVSLVCDAFAHPVTKKIKFLIRPETEKDVERIRKHCEDLPAIMTAIQSAANKDKFGRPKMARWVFDGTVPEYFVLRYQLELRQWAANFKKIGTTKHIILREGALSNVSPDPEQGAELVQVTLKCKIERVRGDEFEIVVSASDEEQERRIAKHCEKMEEANVPAGAVLVEPARPGLPVFPTINPNAFTVKKADE
jgi:hypothetical protein